MSGCHIIPLVHTGNDSCDPISPDEPSKCHVVGPSKLTHTPSCLVPVVFVTHGKDQRCSDTLGGECGCSSRTLAGCAPRTVNADSDQVQVG